MAGPVRHPIDLVALEKYISVNVPEIALPFKLEQFGFGQSNPTYQLTDSTQSRFVLRKKPPGKIVSKTAHNVEREHTILSALWATDVPVPETITFCSDVSVIGTQFYIMRFLDGRIIQDPAIPEAASPQERTAMWKEAIRVLATLHKLVPADVGLSRYGKHGHFYSRQLSTFSTISTAQAQVKDVETGTPVGNIPHYDDMVSFFKQNQPVDRISLVHGDYKIDNLVFHKTEPRVIGVLDWEMSTVGHPLSDLANLLNPYLVSALPAAREIGVGSADFLPGSVPGLPTKEQCVEWYRQAAGWDPTVELVWGEAFSLYRGSVIMQGIAARQAVRQASSSKAQMYAAMMEPYGNMAWKMICQFSKSTPRL